MKSVTFRRSPSLNPTGRQMRVLNEAYFDKGTAITPSFAPASIRLTGSPPPAAGPMASPT